MNQFIKASCALLLLATTAAFGDDQKPKFCIIQTNAEVEVAPNSYGTAQGGLNPLISARERAEMMTRCSQLRADNPKIKCSVTVENVIGSQNYVTVVGRFTREMTPEEKLERLCSDLAQCLIQSVAQSDTKGVLWSKTQAKEIGCGF